MGSSWNLAPVRLPHHPEFWTYLWNQCDKVGDFNRLLLFGRGTTQTTEIPYLHPTQAPLWSGIVADMFQTTDEIPYLHIPHPTPTVITDMFYRMTAFENVRENKELLTLRTLMIMSHPSPGSAKSWWESARWNLANCASWEISSHFALSMWSRLFPYSHCNVLPLLSIYCYFVPRQSQCIYICTSFCDWLISAAVSYCDGGNDGKIQEDELEKEVIFIAATLPGPWLRWLHFDWNISLYVYNALQKLGLLYSRLHLELNSRFFCARVTWGLSQPNTPISAR